MKIDRFIQLFVVKEKKFYPLYIAQLENIKVAAADLRSLFLESNIEQQKELYKKINNLEMKGDQITANIYEELNKTFVTPFDREDIHILASRIDTFLDFIHDAARKLVMYQPKTTHKDLITIVDFIVEDAQILAEIIADLEFIAKKSDSITLKCRKIKEIEHKVDGLYEDFNTFLFQTEKDAIELVKNKNIVQSLEDTTDRAKDISDSIRSIIVKLA
jgi:predicted phosphate transport protein (TIGR00153 family)